MLRVIRISFVDLVLGFIVRVLLFEDSSAYFRVHFCTQLCWKIRTLDARRACREIGSRSGGDREKHIGSVFCARVCFCHRTSLFACVRKSSSISAFVQGRISNL